VRLFVSETSQQWIVESSRRNGASVNNVKKYKMRGKCSPPAVDRLLIVTQINLPFCCESFPLH
jgi:hypothetical protein